MSLIAIVLLVAAALAVALALRAIFTVYPAPAIRDSILSAREQALVAAFADTLFPPGGPIPISGTEAGLVAYMDRNVRTMPDRTRALMRLLFLFLELEPWVFGPFAPRFTHLSQSARIAALEKMSRSGIYFCRISFLSMRTMLTMGYLANDVVARRIGCVPCAAPFDRGPAPRGPTFGGGVSAPEVTA